MREPEHIGLNIVFLDPGMGGMETYVRHLVPQLLELRPNLRLSVFVNPVARPSLAAEPWADSVELVTHPALGRRYTRAISELTLLGWLADRRKLDVLHSLGMTAPVRTRVANVVTVPDLIWLHHPDSLSRVTTTLWRLVVPPVLRRADRILTFSRASRDDIVRSLHVPQEKVDVALLGPGAPPTTTPTPEPELRERLGLDSEPIVLTVSMKVPHKNLGRLVQAMSAVRGRVPKAVLVLPGHPTAHEEELRQMTRTLGLSENVRFCGWLSAEDLEGLYRCATCFVYPSLREGFGLPVLEAMQRGVSVACSNVSSLPELAGDAALYFDPASTEAIADGIVNLLEDDDLRARLVAAGHERQRAFSWRRTADETFSSYKRAWAGRT